MKAERLLVIGAAAGIGRAMAAALEARGHIVFHADCAFADQPESRRFHVDAGDEGLLLALRSRLEWLGHDRLDGLIITCGAIREGPLLGLPRAQWDFMLRQNLYTALYSVEAFLPLMGKGGRILLAGSGAAYGPPNPGLALYSISKSAQLTFARALRQELLPHGISVSLMLFHPVAGSPVENAIRLRGERPGDGSPGGAQRVETVSPESVADAFAGAFLAGEPLITNDPGLRLRAEEGCKASPF